MYDVEMHDVSEQFAECWRAAGLHIETKAQGPLKSWLKANLSPPFLEHLSFRLGNQLFFVRIESVDNKLDEPGNRRGLRMVAEGCRGHACIMPMRDRGGVWVPDAPGWGLLNAETGAPVDPVALVSDELIEMTDWELQDFAVQIVREHLEKLGRKLMSWQGCPAIDPSIWFIGDEGPEWVVVRAVRFPRKSADPPEDWQELAERCAHIGNVGHYASVPIASADDAFDPSGVVPATPLWRGHAVLTSFKGLAAAPAG